MDASKEVERIFLRAELRLLRLNRDMNAAKVLRVSMRLREIEEVKLCSFRVDVGDKRGGRVTELQIMSEHAASFLMVNEGRTASATICLQHGMLSADGRLRFIIRFVGSTLETAAVTGTVDDGAGETSQIQFERAGEGWLNVVDMGVDAGEHHMPLRMP